MPGLPVHLQDMDIQYMDILGAFIQPIIDSFYSAFLSFFKHFQAFIYYLMPDMQAHTDTHTHTHTQKVHVLCLYRVYKYSGKYYDN